VFIRQPTLFSEAPEQIFRNLPPYELLRLARTTKSLRAVLLNRNARSVWIDALEAVPGLPACPVDMSEPAYTRLVFDTHCSVRTRAPFRNPQLLTS
jgi:hypothetical protein